MAQKRFVVEMDEGLADVLKNSGQIKIVESRQLKKFTVPELEAMGYTVFASHWTATGGKTGTSWVVSDPEGTNAEDYYGSEARAWRAAARHAATGQFPPA